MQYCNMNTYLSPWTITSNSAAMFDFMLSCSSANSPEKKKKQFELSIQYIIILTGLVYTCLVELLMDHSDEVYTYSLDQRLDDLWVTADC